MLVSQVPEQRCDPVVADRMAVLAESGGEGVAGEQKPVPTESISGSPGRRQQRGSTAVEWLADLCGGRCRLLGAGFRGTGSDLGQVRLGWQLAWAGSRHAMIRGADCGRVDGLTYQIADGGVSVWGIRMFEKAGQELDG